MNAFIFPEIDPVAFSLGPISIYWYGIAYVAGILLGWQYARYLIPRFSNNITLKDLDDFVFWATIGIILGGRLGYVLFYNPMEYLTKPWEIFYLWHADSTFGLRGMSFHGGLVGVAIAVIWFCIRRKISILAFGDIIASATPIGLFFGRIANFINAELYGKVTDVPWAVIFPNAGPNPRHPSQLYEAILEGLVLFIALFGIEYWTNMRRTRPGFQFAIFLIGYGLARVFIELFRQPDHHIGYLVGGTTIGQLLSSPLLLIGALLTWHVLHQKKSGSPRV